MIKGLKRKLFFWRRHHAAFERLSVDQLQHMKAEADYLNAAVHSAKGMLAAEDIERLKALTRTLEDSARSAQAD